MTKWLGKHWFGCDIDAARPVDEIGSIRRPILLIHGDADPITPLQHARRLTRAAGTRPNSGSPVLTGMPVSTSLIPGSISTRLAISLTIISTDTVPSQLIWKINYREMRAFRLSCPFCFCCCIRSFLFFLWGSWEAVTRYVDFKPPYPVIA